MVRTNVNLHFAMHKNILCMAVKASVKKEKFVHDYKTYKQCTSSLLCESNRQGLIKLVYFVHICNIDNKRYSYKYCIIVD
jgi:uncharacterized protein YwgA